MPCYWTRSKAQQIVSAFSRFPHPQGRTATIVGSPGSIALSGERLLLVAVCRAVGPHRMERDGYWKISTFEGSVHDRLREQWHAQWTRFENVAVVNGVGPITFIDDRARASCWVREVAKEKGGGILLMTGDYDDELKRENGVWRFARRDDSLLSSQMTG